MSVSVHPGGGFAERRGISESASDMRIGNDLVDLVAAANPSRDFRRYSERICTQRELAWLDSAFADRSQSARVRAVWCLWAAKEAVFKAGYPRGDRETGNRGASAVFFVPRSVEVLPDARLQRASVMAVDDRAAGLTVRFAHAARSLHALCYSRRAMPPHFWSACTARVLDARASCNTDSGGESAAVRELVFARLENLYGFSRDQMAISGGRASGRPPWLELRLREDGDPLRVPISLSHDGERVAAAVPRIPLLN